MHYIRREYSDIASSFVGQMGGHTSTHTKHPFIHIEANCLMGKYS